MFKKRKELHHTLQYLSANSMLKAMEEVKVMVENGRYAKPNAVDLPEADGYRLGETAKRILEQFEYHGLDTAMESMVIGEVMMYFQARGIDYKMLEGSARYEAIRRYWTYFAGAWLTMTHPEVRDAVAEKMFALTRLTDDLA